MAVCELSHQRYINRTLISHEKHIQETIFPLLRGLLLASVYIQLTAPKYDYMQFTAVESILPGGLEEVEF